MTRGEITIAAMRAVRALAVTVPTVEPKRRLEVEARIDRIVAAAAEGDPVAVARAVTDADYARAAEGNHRWDDRLIDRGLLAGLASIVVSADLPAILARGRFPDVENVVDVFHGPRAVDVRRHPG